MPKFPGVSLLLPPLVVVAPVPGCNCVHTEQRLRLGYVKRPLRQRRVQHQHPVVLETDHKIGSKIKQRLPRGRSARANVMRRGRDIDDGIRSGGWLLARLTSSTPYCAQSCKIAPSLWQKWKCAVEFCPSPASLDPPHRGKYSPWRASSAFLGRTAALRPVVPA